MNNSNAPKYAIISGLGRSGTNWLLELFNLSAETYCRNEPYASAGSPLAELEYYRFVNREFLTELNKSWDEAVRKTLLYMGYRDPVTAVDKEFMHKAAYKFGLYRMVRGRKYRKLLSLALPGLRGEQWPTPAYLYDLQKQRQAFGVIKLTRSPGWTNFVLKHRPGVPVFHIVRHPGGYLNSWATRYLSTTNKESSARLKRLVLVDICATDLRWREIMGDVDAMGLEEVHLWYWVYMNRTVHEAGQDNPNFHLIAYEDLVTAQSEMIKPFFQKCGLVWTPEIETEINKIGRSSSSISRAWKERLTSQQVEMAEKFAEMGQDFLTPRFG